MSLKVSDDEYRAMLVRTGKAPRPALSAQPAKGNKFHAVPTRFNGLRFHSSGEAERYSHLLMMERAGLIYSLRRQIPYKLMVNGRLVTTFVADFVYYEDGKRVIEDFKGVRTPEYRLKAKLFRALTGVTIRETSR